MIWKKKLSIWQVILTILMVLFTLTMIVPILNVLARSLSDSSVSTTMSGLEIFPRKINFINYQIVFNHPVFMQSFINSTFITIVGTLINIILTTMAAYALTRPDMVFKKVIMAFLICMMLFDPGLVPEYLVIQQIGLMGSQWAVILVASVNVFYLVIMMRFFSEIPQSLFEAAKIDGSGHIRIFWNIVLPLAKPGIATITMFYAVARWNEYFKSGIYITSTAKTVLQVILRQFTVTNEMRTIIGAQNLLNYNMIARLDYDALKCATIIIATVPIIIIYPFVLKYYTKDIMNGSIKE